MDDSSSMPRIVPLSPRQAAEAARLHRDGIAAGFLSSLGLSFLRQLYKAICRCPSGFGLVALQGQQVVGFIACAENTGRLYRQALLRRGLWMAFPILRFLVRPRVVRRMWQTFRYPTQAPVDMPPAEILSIAVCPEMRGKGVGRLLVEATFEEFRRRGVSAVRVAAGDDLAGAHALYERCGFRLAQTRMHHGLPMRVYTISL